MGLSQSTSTSFLSKETDIVNLMMPLYYSTEKLSKEEYDSASASWNSILNDQAANYLLLKKEKSIESSSCISFFYDSFYMRLFELHPLAKALFKKGIKSQGTFLVQMISLALNELNNPIKIKNTLIKLAEVHNERGIKAIECKIKYIKFF
jgi:hypothetical protein